jgi:hypothetical protein
VASGWLRSIPATVPAKSPDGFRVSGVMFTGFLR